MFKPPATASNDLITTVTGVLQQAPQWVRADLSSKDPSLRARAEDALAAMIAAALDEAQTFSLTS